MRGFRHLGPLATLDASAYAPDDLLFFGVTENGPIRDGWWRGRRFDLPTYQALIRNRVPCVTETDHVFVATALGEHAFTREN